MSRKLNLLIFLIALIGLAGCGEDERQLANSATPTTTPLSPTASPNLFTQGLVTMTTSPATTKPVPSPAPTEAKTAASCVPTFGDEASPIYRPDAPMRSSVGHGHILRGVVRSSHDCATIAGARIELLPEDP